MLVSRVTLPMNTPGSFHESAFSSVAAKNTMIIGGKRAAKVQEPLKNSKSTNELPGRNTSHPRLGRFYLTWGSCSLSLYTSDSLAISEQLRNRPF
jgi:hypothetical protein